MIGRLTLSLVAILSFFLISTIEAPAPVMAGEVKTERVSFKPGTSGATVAGKIQGRTSRHYLVGAKAGQNMSVRLEADNGAAYFNIFAPGDTPGEAEAMHIGSTGGNEYAGTLPETGDYLIQVYLYRSAARRNEIAHFKLNISIDANTDAKVPGTEFNVTGKLGCARGGGQPLGQCDFGVVRNADGTAVLTIFWPGAGNRIIYFENGNPVRYDESEADGGAIMNVSKNADLITITVGDQRFEFPEAAINGG